MTIVKMMTKRNNKHPFYYHLFIHIIYTVIGFFTIDNNKQEKAL